MEAKVKRNTLTMMIMILCAPINFKWCIEERMKISERIIIFETLKHIKDSQTNKEKITQQKNLKIISANIRF